MRVSCDDAGNLIRDHRGYRYYYDYENRIVKITESNGTTPVATYSYDALARRIEKIDSKTARKSRRYYYGKQWQVLVETDTSNNEKAWFIYGNYIDEVLRMTDSSNNKYYYVHEHLYSPVALLSSSGTPLERYEYDAYGYCHVLHPTTYADDPDGISDKGNPYFLLTTF